MVWVNKKEYRELIEGQSRDAMVMGLKQQLVYYQGECARREVKELRWMQMYETAAKENRAAHKGIHRLKKRIKFLLQKLNEKKIS